VLSVIDKYTKNTPFQTTQQPTGARKNLLKMRLIVVLLVGVLTIVNGFQSTAVRRNTSKVQKNLKYLGKSSSSPLFMPTKTLAASTDGGDSKVVPDLPDWDPTNWTPKRLHNTAFFRFSAMLATIGVASYAIGSSPVKVSAKASATIHILAFATWFGSMAYTTFIGGITMFKNLPRKTFGKLQSKLFPIYFNLCAITILLQILTLNFLPTVVTKKATVALGVSLVMTVLNLFYLEPTSTKIMFERYALEETSGGKDTDKYKKLAANFGKFHGMSSLTNLIALCGAIAHGFYLATALVV